MSRPPFLLCILDGVGLNPSEKGNAVFAAHTPTLDRLFAQYPNSTLTTHGEAVGLPEGQMGNSEVGHLNIGAGRVVKQWLLRIRDAFAEDEVQPTESFQNFVRSLSQGAPNSHIHLIGLCSFGGVHSHLEHLFSLFPLLTSELPQSKLVLHFIADGRDVSPHQFLKDLDAIEAACKPYAEQIVPGSLSGRYFAMDRDSRWERTGKAFHAMTDGSVEEAVPLNEGFQKLRELVQQEYDRGTTDEFLTPIHLSSPAFSAKDGVLFWNFRSDRMRQIVRAFSEVKFSEFERRTPLPQTEQVLCFAEYDQTFQLPVLFPSEAVRDHLGEVLSRQHLTQLRVAETEKYPHVTYFLNGGDETICEGEERGLIPSPRDVKTYDEKPEMSAYEVTDLVVNDIQSGAHDCIILNFANCDMVGHTGDFDAAVKAVETVDTCLGKILDEMQKKDGTALIIADHGNAEKMIDEETGGPHTAHTTFPVPVILFCPDESARELSSGGSLCDVAPTALELLGITPPAAMTGKSLLKSRD